MLKRVNRREVTHDVGAKRMGPDEMQNYGTSVLFLFLLGDSAIKNGIVLLKAVDVGG